jgi:hypothetical protein
MEEVYYEFAHTVKDRVGRCLTLEEGKDFKGFRSIFGFSKAVAEHFESQKRVINLKSFPLYADTLFIDVDDDLKAAEDAYYTLINLGVGFEVFDSGGRSIHFHIAHSPIEGYDLAYTHKRFILSNNIRCDMSIFEEGRIFRLEGTVHLRTFKPKVLLETVPGNLLHLERLEPPPKSYESFGAAEGLADMVLTLSSVLDNGIQRGRNAHATFFRITAALAHAGFSAEFALELLNRVNETLVDDPANEADFNKSISNIFSSLYSTK